MWRINLRILALTLGVVAFYTAVAHVIPQLESEVPEALALGTDASPEALVAAGERVYNGAGGCAACHGLGARAPNLLTDHGGQGAIGARCGTRRPGMSCKAYLHEAMVRPAAYVVPGFEPIMPDMSRQLDAQQVWAVVAYLESLGGEVTVSAADLQAAGPAAGAPGATGAAPTTGAGSATLDPVRLLNEKGCIACHQLEGKGGPVGPPLDRIGRTRSADYLRRAILVPAADTAAGYERFAGTMPATFGQQLTAAQLEALVAYLAGRR